MGLWFNNESCILSKALLFLRRQEEGAPVYVTKSLGAGRWSTPKLTLTRTAPFSWGAYWSPDGKWILAVSDGAVVAAPADSGAVRVLARGISGQPRFDDCMYGVDGSNVYCKSHDAQGRALMYAIPSSGGSPRIILSFPDLTKPSYRPDFAVDTKKFYFVIQDRQSNVWIADIAR